MSLGVPVICSNHASLPEVAGDAAVYFDPLCVDEMAQTMAEVASDDVLLKRLREKGFDNIQRFDWSKAATETLAVYEAVASAA
jgi:glycosyltransferase involved in cell wall biosynthesis